VVKALDNVKPDLSRSRGWLALALRFIAGRTFQGRKLDQVSLIFQTYEKVIRHEGYMIPVELACLSALDQFTCNSAVHCWL
jgi:hypothetical protein